MSLHLTHAMILAAGFGTRMRPLTDHIPKPLLTLAGKPFIDWNLDWLQAANIAQVVINTSYRAEQLEAHVAMRETPHITISREGSPPLETGGGIYKALPYLGEGPFLAMNSDAILLNDHAIHPVRRLADAWRDDMDFLMLLVPRARAQGWAGKGDFIADAHGRIRRPQPGEDAEYIFSGVEIMHPRVFRDCPHGAFSLGTLWKKLETADGWHRRIGSVIHDGDWLNVGDLEGLAAAEHYFRARQAAIAAG